MESSYALAASNGTPWRVEIEDGTHRWAADEPVPAGGADTAPTPFQLLCSALAACTSITVRMYAARKQWPLRGIEVRVELNPAGKPEGGANELVRSIRVDGPLDAEQRARLLQVANACRTHKILTGSISIPTSLVEA